MKAKIDKSSVPIIIASIFLPFLLFLFVYENWERKRYFPGKTYLQHLRDKYLPSLKTILVFIIILVIINFLISYLDFSGCEERVKILSKYSSTFIEPYEEECIFSYDGLLSFYNTLDSSLVDWFANLSFFYILTLFYIASANIVYVTKYRKLYSEKRPVKFVVK